MLFFLCRFHIHNIDKDDFCFFASIVAALEDGIAEQFFGGDLQLFEYGAGDRTFQDKSRKGSFISVILNI